MWQALIPAVAGLLDKLIPDPQAAAEAKLKAVEMAQRGELAALDAELRLAVGQLEVNKAEAANPSIFVSGWRPGVGWVCVLGFGVQFVIGPLAEWGSALAGHPVKFPALDLGTMMPLLLGMLGLSGMRTAEKIQGVAAK